MSVHFCSHRFQLHCPNIWKRSIEVYSWAYLALRESYLWVRAQVRQVAITRHNLLSQALENLPGSYRRSNYPLLIYLDHNIL